MWDFLGPISGDRMMVLDIANTETFGSSKNMITALLVVHRSNKPSSTERGIEAMNT